MKIEFKKDTVNGKDTYYTNCNGIYVDSSLRLDKNEAYNLFISIVENKGTLKKTEVLETKIID